MTITITVYSSIVIPIIISFLQLANGHANWVIQDLDARADIRTIVFKDIDTTARLNNTLVLLGSFGLGLSILALIGMCVSIHEYPCLSATPLSSRYHASIPPLYALYPTSVPPLYQLYPTSIPPISRLYPASIPPLSRLCAASIIPLSRLCPD